MTAQTFGFPVKLIFNVRFLMTKFLYVFFFLIPFSSFAETPSAKDEETPRFAIHLLDYLAHDYGGAVSFGKIVSVSEYEEQKEFANKIHELSLALPIIKNEKKTFQKIIKLKAMIESKEEALLVAQMARDIQKDLISITKITLAPVNSPSLKNGKILFSKNCMECHGQEGFGDGPLGKDLDPKPANFHEPERMSAISAFHSYNTIRLGVPGTGMLAWNNFTDKEVWDLSFYVMSLRHREMAQKANFKLSQEINDFTLTDLATLSDKELKQKMKKEDDEDKKNYALAFLRNKTDDTSSGELIGIAKSYLTEALKSYKENTPQSKKMAKQLALQSYLEGIEPIEPMMKANDPALVVKVENAMLKVRKLISSPENNILELTVQVNSTLHLLTEVEEAILKKELSFGVAFSGAFAIILREGFEAVLIILTLLSVIKVFGNKKAAWWVHAGWSSALGVGFIAWLLSSSLMKMSGASREILEAATSSFAVIILLYFGFWLHRQTEISRWKKFIQEKVQGAIDNKNLFGLFSIAFISVFREAFETVLFIRALWFQTNNNGKNAISLGLTVALVIIFIFSYITLRYSKKLPVQKLFKISSFLTIALAFILSGKAIHSLQEAGVLNASFLPWQLRVDTLGLFPTWQTLGAQMGTFIIALVLINFNTKKSS